MRIGQNPAKFIETVAQPADITVTVVCCIPFLSGFYQQSLDVLKTCIYSLHNSKELPFDIMVFDNHSCREVREFLTETHGSEIIQYLVLSDKNIGKIGAWNYMFGAAQGRYIAFADSDIYFHPGWLSASLSLFEAFPKVGMVTGRPLRTPPQFFSATIEWGRRQSAKVFQEGTFLDWQTYIEHTNSIGLLEEEARRQYQKGKDYFFFRRGQSAFAGAAHFQFLSRKYILQQVLPLPSEKPMRGERALDIAIDKLGYLRLCTEKAFILHMGNRLPTKPILVKPDSKNKPMLRRFIHFPVIRHVLLWMYNKIFQLYFHDME